MAVFDVILFLIVVLFAALGVRRGLVLTVCGLLSIVVALGGAKVAADSLSPMVAEAITPRIVAHLQRCRDTLVPLLQAVPGVRTSAAPGGMYAFLRIEGQDDSLSLAKRLVAEAGLGLAPGIAFGPEAEGWLRWCFASQDAARLGQGVDRLRAWLAAQA